MQPAAAQPSLYTLPLYLTSSPHLPDSHQHQHLLLLVSHRLQKSRYLFAVLDFIFHVRKNWLPPMVKKLLYLNDSPALIPSPITKRKEL